MKKSFVFVAACLTSVIAYSNHCPPASEIFVKQGDKFVTLTPSGWQWTKSWGGEPEFQSENVKLNWVMWDSERMVPEDKKRVHCIYGNPEFDGSHSGGLLQTIDIVERTAVEGKANWHQYGNTYFRCVSSDVLHCLFG